ncbi:hypothetical protein TNCT_427941 [Trichonephila clavata]|uniref:Uncharacterized protein n=1 Tax=Trichonephila clavata TaxID=2740835 RepID=A0A8X6IJF1_TRICU|nr:hypothetical protein TNCT_427941 [Trichonephila clavata]
MGNCRVNPYLGVDELYNGFQRLLIGSSSNEAVTAGPRTCNEPTGLSSARPLSHQNSLNVFIPLKNGPAKSKETDRY